MGYKVVEQNQFGDNIIVLECSHKNIYWIANKLIAVKFPGLDNKRLFVHVLSNGESGYYSNGCFSVQNDRSTLMSLFTALSVGDIDYSSCGEFVEVEFDSEYCVVKGVSESGNVSDMFNTCRANFIVEYIKEFVGDYSNVRIGMAEARLDESING